MHLLLHTRSALITLRPAMLDICAAALLRLACALHVRQTHSLMLTLLLLLLLLVNTILAANFKAHPSRAVTTAAVT
jgi:hypothetical protein